MTVKAIVCLNESPGYELIHDKMNLIEGYSNHLFKYFTDSVEISDSHNTNQNRMVYDSISGVDNVEVYSSNMHTNMADISEEIGFGIIKNIDETILINDTDFVGIAGMVQSNFGSMQMFDVLGFDVEKSLSESVGLSDEVSLISINQNMFNNQMIGSTVFN